MIGSALVLDGLGSRTYSTILGIVGLLYGTMGIAYRHVALDWVLILGAALILIHTFAKKSVHS